ncbi:MAG: carbohydrate-binding protein [Rhodothermales bacterium]|nr:carbohydrate-binding protein [Rhodothermales bacterium]
MMRGLLGLLFLAILSMEAGAATATPAAPPSSAHGFKALVFSRTTGFRHDSIDEGIDAIQALGAGHDFEVVATEDPSVFTDAGLDAYQVIIFLNTTGDVLNVDQQGALERFMADGGGWVGIHAAADTEYAWSWYGGLVGAWFASHPNIQSATVRVLDRDHPSTGGLPQEWLRTDEWYDYQSNPRGQVHVLATLDDDSYSGGTMGFDHPIAWCRPYQGGRSWYTGMGHTAESYSEPGFLDHLLGGIEWAAGAVEGACSATIGSNYDLEVLEPDVESPMDLEVAPDGSVFFVELGGLVRRYDPQTRFTTTVAEIDVFQNFEDGLIGIVLDPSFETTGWLYLFYSPAGGAPRQHISRFTWDGSVIDPASESVILEIPTQRQECCHSGGSMVFDAAGNLYIATGDNTNPFASDGYAPIDEQSGRAPWDAQKSSSNAADLRGKILRITPQPDGTYTVPEGNLFPGGVGGSPEVYVMGVRNPFRISVDPGTGWLYWGDVGPDARNATAGRGPAGLDEWNQAREPGNYGWPYCIGPNTPYNDFNFASGASGGVFDCASPVNDSPNNTGPQSLPPAKPAWIWYPYGPSSDFPGITDGPGRTAMAGPVYQYVASRPGDIGLPAYFQDRLLIYEWSRSWIRVVTLDDDGNPLSIDPFPGDPEMNQPIAMKAGPDGALYLLEWGSGFGTGNPDAQLSRIASTQGGKRPEAVITTDVVAGPLPLTVTFSGADSSDPEGDLLSFSWDVNGDGVEDGAAESLAYTFTEAGGYTARLRVSDPFGNESLASVTITAGNSAPTLVVNTPVPGGFFDWGDRISFDLTVNDAEDGSTGAGTIDCSRVVTQLFIGHDAHTHPLTSVTGCSGEVELTDGHGGDGDRIFHVLEFSYTDQGADGVPGITSTEEVVLLPSRLEAEHYDAEQGTQTENTADPSGGNVNLGFLDHGDWIRFDNVSLRGVHHLTFRVASAGSGGRIEVRPDLQTGDPLATAIVTPTGDWQRWRDVTIPVSDEGDGPLFLVFLNEPGNTGLFNINYLVAHGPGASDGPAGLEGFSASYVNGGNTQLTRIEPQISFDWGASGPEGGDRATWQGVLQVPTSGNFTYTLRARGTATLSVDGAEVLRVDSPSGIGEVTSGLQRLRSSLPVLVDVDLTAGPRGAAIWLEMEGPGVSETVGEGLVTPTGTISTESPGDLPEAFAVGATFPNPAQTSVFLDLEVPVAGEVQAAVFDLLGRRVRDVPARPLAAGRHTLTVSVDGLSSGVYYVVVSTGSRQFARPVVLAR